MVEVIVVVVLMMILASGTVFGISEWQRWLSFRKQNDTAQTLYLNMQSQLTRQIENGGGQEVLSALTGENQEFLHVLAENPESYTGEICYVIGTAADYEKYVQYVAGAISLTDLDNAETGMTGKELAWFYELLTAGLYDPSVLNAAVCAEFTPYDGQVYSVFYSEKADYFSYGEGGTDITHRETDARKETMTGYYGVDTLSEAKMTAARPELSEVQLTAGDVLKLEFQVTETPEARTGLTYEITLYDGGTEEPLLRLWLPGNQLKTADSTFAPIWCEVSQYADGAWTQLTSSAVNENERGKYPFYAKLIGENGVQLILDAADVTAEEDAWERVLQYGDTAAKAQMDASSSLYRFGLSAEQLYCTVQGGGMSYQNTQSRQSNRAWCKFASVRMEQRDTGAVQVRMVENMRELYNIRYDAIQNPDVVTEYQLVKNMDWDAFVANGNLFSGCQVMAEENAVFPSIQTLQASQSLISGTGQPIALSGLRLANHAGVTGLIGHNAGTIHHLTLQKIQVQGSGMTGTVCGWNTGTLDQIIVTDAEITVTGNAETPAMAGGVVGKNSGSVTNRETSGRMTVDGGTEAQPVAAGGLIGVWEQGAAELTNSSNHMQVELRCDGYAAGLIGRLQNQSGAFLIRSCSNDGTIQKTGTSDGDSALAGILAAVSGCGDMTLRLEQCVNEGDVNGAAVRTAGIVAISQSGDDQTAWMELFQCQNHGNGDQETFCGIASVIREQDMMDECEDFSDSGNSGESSEDSSEETLE